MEVGGAAVAAGELEEAELEPGFGVLGLEPRGLEIGSERGYLVAAPLLDASASEDRLQRERIE